jgi:hypothetical protein
MPKTPKNRPRRVTADKFLRDLAFHAVPDDETPEAAFVLIKTRDSQGPVGWYSRVSQTYNQMEFLGALVTYTDSERAGLADAYFQADESAPADHLDR